MTTRRSTLYATGERGRNRVRVCEDRRTGFLALEYADENGRRVRTSCRTRDPSDAKRMADELAARFARDGRPTASATPLTLARLFEKRHGSITLTTAEARAARLLCEIVGRGKRCDELRPSDLERFAIERRRRGSLSARDGRAVRARTIQHDVKVLLAALRWAVRERLLARHPLEYYRVAGETSPRRPGLVAQEYAAMLEAADRVHPFARPLLVLARETGHRINAVLSLRWEDVNTAQRRVVWRAAHDKKRREHTTPLSQAAVTALDVRAADLIAAGGSLTGPVFPASNGEPVRVDVARAWWLRMENLAGIAHVAGRGWHSLRRAFATELMREPLAVLKALGGWADAQTIVQCYQRPAEEELQRALDARELRA